MSPARGACFSVEQSRKPVPRSPPGRERSMRRGVDKHPNRGTTVGSTDASCGWQLQEGQGEVEFQNVGECS